MIKCNDNQKPPRNADNIYVRFYKNSCVMGFSRPFSIGVMRPLAFWEKKPHRDEMYIIQRADSEDYLFIGYQGTLGMDLRRMFKERLFTEKPTFQQVREYFECRNDLEIKTYHNLNLKG